MISIDTSKNGEFLLVATRSLVMLIPTMQNGKNGFNFTFRKNNKPQPKVLRVSPRAMNAHEIEQFSFTSAKFDNRKDEKEGMIVATSGRHVIVWSLKNVMRGRLETSRIKSYDETIIGNDFRYNSDRMVNALQHKIVVQDSHFR